MPSVAADPDYNDEHGILMKWQEAQGKCLHDLRPNEKEALENLKGPEDLINDLHRRQREYSDNTLRNLLGQIFPILNLLQTLSHIFLTSIISRPVEMALLWGLLHLVIKSSLLSKEILEKMVEILDKIRKELALFGNCAPYLNNPYLNNRTELQHSLVDMFVALINFWTQAMRYLRKSSAERFLLDTWPKLNAKFEEALKEINSAVEHVHKLASVGKLPSDERFSAASLFTTSDDNGAALPCFEMPPRNKYFVGRERTLLQMDEFLDPELCNNDLSSYIICGLGGVGKSSLALTYATNSQDSTRYDAIFWIKAQTSPDIRDSFSRMALRLELAQAGPNFDIDNNIVLFKNWLAKSAKRWLLVYDNVEDISLLSGFLPSSNGSIVITTRYENVASRRFGRTLRLELGPLAWTDGMQLFRSLRSSFDAEAQLDDEPEEAKEILHELGGLPLGIELYSAYIGFRHYTLRQFLNKQDKVARQVLKTDAATETSHSLASVWEMHFEAIMNSNASQLLGVMSLISPDDIPVELFQPTDENVVTSFTSFCVDEDDLEDAIDLLMKNALIKRNGDRISLHRLVQKAFRHSPSGLSSPRFQSAFEATVLLVRDRFPSTLRGQSLVDHGQDASLYLPHILALSKVWQSSQETKQPLQSCEAFVELLHDSSWYQFEIGTFDECLIQLEVAERACKDKQSMLCGRLYNTRACLCHELNNNPGCKEACKKCLAIYENLPDSTPDLSVHLANAKSNFGNAMAAECRWDEALSLYRLAEQERLQLGPSGAYYLGLSYLSIGRVYFFQGQLSEAEEFYQKTRRLYTEHGYEKSFLMASLLLAEGNVAAARGNWGLAREKYRDDIETMKDFSPLKLSLATSNYRLGRAEAHLGHFDVAMECFDKGLAIAAHHNHQGDVARILRQRALTLRKKGSISEEERNSAETDLLSASLLRMKVSADVNWFKTPAKDEDDAYDRLVCCSFW
ncbi:hypothetical protein EV356DRAFT_580965 [Viridothelium virens]|uniref:Uncharacterized protein n=1 Tax=Viridothelium virens TaxID=1048519 RepID=A0A6A6GUH6_VIRVR|nr:hypothetical protein EV356DRAFT_580965 [Viridothelium virens]